MRITFASLVVGSVALFSTGCEVGVRPASVTVAGPAVAVEGPDVEVQGPLFEGPGAIAVDVEPPIAEREYVYDPGFPPGVYLYGGFYYYGGYRYSHDVFIDRVVHRNIAAHRYMDRDENRRFGQRIVQTHRETFNRTGGRRTHEERR